VSLIDDYTWSIWAKELVDLQAKYPEISLDVCFADAFKDWDGSTGMKLPLSHPWVVSRAERLTREQDDEHQKVQQRTGEPSSQTVERKTTTKQRSDGVQERRRLF
jgi:hypothetical protein